MIEEITIKFGTELKPTQNSCKLQLYHVIYYLIHKLIFLCIILDTKSRSF